MTSYYNNILSSERLKLCYEIAPKRVKQYLQAEIDFVNKHISYGTTILELGCGYGRVIEQLKSKNIALIGIDTSIESLILATSISKHSNDFYLANMNAISLGFNDAVFDLVFCIQNGISAFHVDKKLLISEAIRVTKKGCKVLFSSYSEIFWEERLNWFRIQSKHGLVGEIDEEATGNGKIICKDGFTTTTVNQNQFKYSTSDINHPVNIFEVDESSIFCEITK